MSELKVEGVTHWSMPVNDLDESERFYGDLLGFNLRGRLGTSGMSCVSVGENNILLCQRETPVESEREGEGTVHHSFTVSPETFEQACKVFLAQKVNVSSLVYRAQGYFTGRELYFFDPSWNRLELRDPTWVKGMPEPPFEEIAKA